MTMFLGKALLIGFLGALGGYLIGLAVAFQLEAGTADEVRFSFSTLFDSELFLAAIVIAPTVATLASWVPAVLAANSDPATILSQE